jgi:hypothetical protein
LENYIQQYNYSQKETYLWKQSWTQSGHF